MERLLASGIPFELAGLIYFAFYLLMSRGPNAARFSRRTKVLTLVTAIVMVAAVPLHYGATNVGIFVMVILAVSAMISTWADRSSP